MAIMPQFCLSVVQLLCSPICGQTVQDRHRPIVTYDYYLVTIPYSQNPTFAMTFYLGWTSTKIKCKIQTNNSCIRQKAVAATVFKQSICLFIVKFCSGHVRMTLCQSWKEWSDFFKVKQCASFSPILNILQGTEGLQRGRWVAVLAPGCRSVSGPRLTRRHGPVTLLCLCTRYLHT